MFKKTMKFDDLDGNEVTQTFYFNYNKKEVAELVEFGAIQEYADPNRTYIPLEKQLELLSTPVEESGLSQADNNRQAYAIFQDLILDAYGEKAADNRGFDKSQELRRYWKNHNAFVDMIWEFLENPTLAGEFIENCLPGKMVAQVKNEMQAENSGKLTDASLSAMVAEAAERQKNPETRIEPGVIPEDADPTVLKLANSVAEQEEPEKKIEDLTPEDILNMDEVSFKKIDPRTLSQEQMLAAFKRKTS